MAISEDIKENEISQIYMEGKANAMEWDELS